MRTELITSFPFLKNGRVALHLLHIPLRQFRLHQVLTQSRGHFLYLLVVFIQHPSFAHPN